VPPLNKCQRHQTDRIDKAEGAEASLPGRNHCETMIPVCIEAL